MVSDEECLIGRTINVQWPSSCLPGHGRIIGRFMRSHKENNAVNSGEATSSQRHASSSHTHSRDFNEMIVQCKIFAWSANKEQFMFDVSSYDASLDMHLVTFDNGATGTLKLSPREEQTAIQLLCPTQKVVVDHCTWEPNMENKKPEGSPKQEQRASMSDLNQACDHLRQACKRRISASRVVEKAKNKEKATRKRDVGWDHGEMINDNRLWTKCKYCWKEMRGGGVSRLKEHIAGSYSNVARCEECPLALSKAMKELLGSKKEKSEVIIQKSAHRDTLLEPIQMKFDNVGNDYDVHLHANSDEDISVMEREHLKTAMHKSMEDMHEGQGRIEHCRFYQGDSSSHRLGKRKLDAFGFGGNKSGNYIFPVTSSPVTNCSKSKDDEEQTPKSTTSPPTPVTSVCERSKETVDITGYEVKATSAPILEAIFTKYGDIACNCLFKSKSVRTSFLEVVCDVSNLQNYHSDTILLSLETIENEISDVEAAKVDVSWLNMHISKLKEVSGFHKENLLLKSSKNNVGLIASENLRVRRLEYQLAKKRVEEAEKFVDVMKLVSRKIDDVILASENEEYFWRRRLGGLLEPDDGFDMHH